MWVFALVSEATFYGVVGVEGGYISGDLPASSNRRLKATNNEIC